MINLQIKTCYFYKLFVCNLIIAFCLFGYFSSFFCLYALPNNPSSQKLTKKSQKPLTHHNKHDSDHHYQKLSILSGGNTTALKDLSLKEAYSQPLANMPADKFRNFVMGDSLFARMWISFPSSVKSSDGLGPMFSARSCQSCHIKDGRGHLPEINELDTTSIVIKLSHFAEPNNKKLTNRLVYPRNHVTPDPVYGFLFHQFSTMSVKKEGDIEISYLRYKMNLTNTISKTDSNNSQKKPQTQRQKQKEYQTLTRPKLTLKNLNYASMNTYTKASLVIAPIMIGLGLIEAIDPEDIFKKHDPTDKDRDGISGRVSVVKNKNSACNYLKSTDRLKKTLMIGRFGWKAHNPCLNQQNLDAFINDMSMSSTLHKNFYGDCTTYQEACRNAEKLAKINHDNSNKNYKNKNAHNLNNKNKKQDNFSYDHQEPDISEDIANLILFYTQSLAVPKRQIPTKKQDQTNILKGERLFYQIGCESCHTSSYVTANYHPQKHLNNQKIYPYSDFLLHNMGPGLDDKHTTFNADSNEWRTAPLWGLGYSKHVNPNAGYLHDGRAKTINQAILWHGGEARTSRENYKSLSANQKKLLILFLESL